jgi:hypothetical protein
VAVNVMEELAQVGFDPVVIAVAIDGTNTGFIVTVIPELVAVVGLAHAELEVITQLTTSPFAKVVVVKVAEFMPAFIPLTFH